VRDGVPFALNFAGGGRGGGGRVHGGEHAGETAPSLHYVKQRWTGMKFRNEKEEAKFCV